MRHSFVGWRHFCCYRGIQNSIKFFLLLFELFQLFHLPTRDYIVPSKLFFVTYLWNSFTNVKVGCAECAIYALCAGTAAHRHNNWKMTNVKVFIMSDLCISCDSVVNGRRHAAPCDVCEHWQHRLCGTGKIFIFVFLSVLSPKILGAIFPW